MNITIINFEKDYEEQNKKDIKVKCSFCDKLLFLRRSKLKYSKNHFCNRECKHKYQKEKPTWSKGLTKETDERVKRYAEKLKNIPKSKLHCKHISDVRKGKVSSRKGKTFEEFYGIERAKILREKNSNGHKGQIPGNKGKTSPKKGKTNIEYYGEEKAREIKEKSSNKRKKQIPPGLGKQSNKKGKSWEEYYGIERAKEIKRKARMNSYFRKNNEWIDVNREKEYGEEFNHWLREQIRQRDNFTCQGCSKKQSEIKRAFSVHHIDYNKRNNNPNNLISLCTSCHQRSNYNKKLWENLYKNMIEIKNKESK